MLRNRTFYKSLLAVALLQLNITAFAQGKIEDYKRAEAFNASMQNKIYYSPNGFKWLDGKKEFFYSMLTERGTEYTLVNSNNFTKRPAFDQQQFAVALSALAKKEITAYKLPIYGVTFNDDGTNFRFNYDNRLWAYDVSSAKISEISNSNQQRTNGGYWGDRPADQNDRRTKSPDGKWTAFIKNYNVFIVGDDNKEQQLSFDGSEGEYYSSSVSWSPDAKKLATNKVRPNKPHLIYLIESSPTTQLQPILQSRNYLKPGDALPQMQPSLFLIDSKKQVPVDASKIQSQYSLSRLDWRKDSRAFTFEYNQRGHQKYSIVEVNGTNGSVKELVNEEVKTFFSYSGKKYRYDVNDGKEIIWSSERDGWNHLYLYDANGKVKNQITKGDWVMRNVVKVDEQDRTIIFEASGMEKNLDPYFIQYYKINFNGSGLVKLTTENGNHQATFNSDYSKFIDIYSRIDAPQKTLLRDAKTGKILKELENGNADELLKTGWKMPEVFTAKGRDGKTDIWGMIIRPSNFDPAKKYPVIEYIYAGPHDSFVPKNFANDSRGSLHELAELGFIVVQCDGMGTSNRSKAFHDVAWKNLKDGGFPDRIEFIKAAAKKYSYMDTERVGIFGNSAGGQSSLGALLFHPEFYKVAVSSSGCHDNRMDKMWWNEQWMGYPIGPEYAASSNVDNAHKLEGKLLLILGELDDNVDPASTMQVINKLVKANKNFDFLFVPGMGHSLGGDYGERKRRDFFVKHLIGVDPPEWTWKTSVAVPKP
ncbi:S9 family peptidase [Pedobacter namyangjuensis]|uniref:S9 family peptidase n=1 Tax=Pedobacter namyangjuensis TaxID=600626 RepID=UPI000DE2F17F|nr:S9 family peptidase [Pedobacter namyangjuensis]